VVAAELREDSGETPRCFGSLREDGKGSDQAGQTRNSERARGQEAKRRQGEQGERERERASGGEKRQEEGRRAGREREREKASG
jgi:hypothetical protein